MTPYLPCTFSIFRQKRPSIYLCSFSSPHPFKRYFRLYGIIPESPRAEGPESNLVSNCRLNVSTSAHQLVLILCSVVITVSIIDFTVQMSKIGKCSLLQCQHNHAPSSRSNPKIFLDYNQCLNGQSATSYNLQDTTSSW